MRWTLEESGFEIYALDFSPDNRVLAVGSSDGVNGGGGGKVRLFNAMTGELLQTLQGQRPFGPDCGNGIRDGAPLPQNTAPSGRSLAFLPDGRLLTGSESNLIA